MDRAIKHRLAGVLTAGVCLALLLTAARLSADGRGHGTHEQLSLPACSWPAIFNMPCPTCGMTTAFTHSTDLEFASAFHAQPLGALIALATATVFWLATHTALTGSRALPAAASLLSGRGTAFAIGLLIAAWVYKIATWGA